MPGQPRIASPFESIENLSKKAAQPVMQAAADVGRDVAESFGFGQTLDENSQTQIKAKDSTNLQRTRQNLVRINQEMAESRKKREQKWAEQIKKNEQTKQIKQVEQQKKESVLQKMIKSRTGTKEAMQRASG